MDFESLGDKRTRVHLRLNYLPEGVVEQVGDALGVMKVCVAGDLERFKDFIEHRGDSAGWRGEILGKTTSPPPRP